MSKKTYKPIPFYFITTSDMNELTYEKAYESLSTLKARGFGGAVLFNKPPHGFNADEYLTENWFTMLKNFIEAGIALDLEMWLNDGFDFPPGAAGGKVAKIDPTLKQQYLKRENGSIIIKEGEFGFPAFEHPKSSQLFIEIVYESYKKHLGCYFGKGLRGFFSDADNRRVNYQAFKDDRKDGYFPWAGDFRDTFSAKFGYDIWDHIDEILDRKDTQAAVDYWQHCSDLYTQWFKNNYEWCQKNNLEYTFHTSDTSPFPTEKTIRSSVFTEGRFSDMEVHSDYCGTDQELLELNGGKHYAPGFLYLPKVSWGNCAGTRKSPEYYDIYADVRTKQAQSTAFTYDKKGTMCEMFAATNYGATYEELREVATFQIMQGVTFIVPHAYQYRVLGQTKYFAPPDFSDLGYMTYCADFNDTLVKYISYADKGTLDAPIAVFDITEELWRHKDNSDRFFAVCQQLNRMPYGYVIADKKAIERKKDAFSLIINTTDDCYENISGIPVANVRNLNELAAAVKKLPAKITYEGTGYPHYMVRNTDEGACALIANIENDFEITGVVTFGGCKYTINLYPGEVAFFSEKECIYRSPVAVLDSVSLPETCSVTWEKENVLPIARWISKDNKAVIQQEDEDILKFHFNVESSIGNVKLYVPANCVPYITNISGVDLTSKCETSYLHDRYVCYDVNPKLGPNEIIIEKNAPLKHYDRFFLSGEFDVAVDVTNPFYKRNFGIYNLEMYIPEEANITLSTRRTTLDTTKSAALQGHPFYAGGVTYHAEVIIPEDYQNYQLCIKNAFNGVSVSFDNAPETDILYRPYTVACPHSGKASLSLTTYATFANFMEMYPREFGITEGIALHKIK